MEGSPPWWNGRTLVVAVAAGILGMLSGIILALSLPETMQDFETVIYAPPFSILLLPVVVAGSVGVALPLRSSSLASQAAGLAVALTILSPDAVSAMTWQSIVILVGIVLAISSALAVLAGALAGGIALAIARPRRLTPDGAQAAPAPTAAVAQQPMPAQTLAALAQLDARLAEGSISPEDYKQRKSLILNK